MTSAVIYHSGYTDIDRGYVNISELIDSNADELIQKLEGNEITGLTVDGCEIPEEIAIRIAAALEKNSSLLQMKIDMGMDSARVHDLGDKFGLALAAALQKNQAMNDIWLSNCIFTDVTGLAIAAALEKNAVLKKFGLYNCTEITDETGVAIAAALEKNTTLEELHLEQLVKFMDKTGRALAALLDKNTPLKLLQASSFTLTDETGLAMAAALQTNTSLKSLLMICCGSVPAFRSPTEEPFSGLTDTTAEALLAALQQNTTLTQLNVNGSGASQDLLGKLAEKRSQ